MFQKIKDYFKQQKIERAIARENYAIMTHNDCLMEEVIKARASGDIDRQKKCALREKYFLKIKDIYIDSDVARKRQAEIAKAGRTLPSRNLEFSKVDGVFLPKNVAQKIREKQQDTAQQKKKVQDRER